jgi:hypothetical protein
MISKECRQLSNILWIKLPQSEILEALKGKKKIQYTVIRQYWTKTSKLWVHHLQLILRSLRSLSLKIVQQKTRYSHRCEASLVEIKVRSTDNSQEKWLKVKLPPVQLTTMSRSRRYLKFTLITILYQKIGEINRSHPKMILKIKMFLRRLTSPAHNKLANHTYRIHTQLLTENRKNLMIIVLQNTQRFLIKQTHLNVFKMKLCQQSLTKHHNNNMRSI